MPMVLSSTTSASFRFLSLNYNFRSIHRARKICLFSRFVTMATQDNPWASSRQRDLRFAAPVLALDLPQPNSSSHCDQGPIQAPQDPKCVSIGEKR